MTPEDAGWVCHDTHFCGPAIYAGALKTPLGDRTCVPVVILAFIEGGEEPEPFRDEACLPGTDEP